MLAKSTEAAQSICLRFATQERDDQVECSVDRTKLSYFASDDQPLLGTHVYLDWWKFDYSMCVCVDIVSSIA